MGKVTSSEHNQQTSRDHFMQRITNREQSKLRARRQKDQTLWFGLGLLGLVGWSIVVPTLLGLAIGVWIDGQFPSHLSWTLMLMVAGLMLGCLNAWNWVAREQQAMEQSSEPPVQSKQENQHDE
ncbi:MAG: AtpZ/AtpI family protein [Gloeobacterales cyanobacterium]